MSLRTPLGRVRGLGSAKEGVDHWWGQRLSALALVPLAIWFVASLTALTGADHQTLSDWIASPIVAGLLVLLITATFYHGYLGLQVVIEDYVHGEGLKLAAIIAVKGLSILLGVIGILAVLSLCFGAAT